MTRRLTAIFIILLLNIFCFAQQDSLVVHVRGIEIVLMKVEGGTYNRGCNPIKPSHDSCCVRQVKGENAVTVKNFYIAKFETSQQLYKLVTGDNPSYYLPSSKASGQKAVLPVESVSWYAVQIFIDTLNSLTGLHFRLPTEAEWEYAARSGKYKDYYYYSGSNTLGLVSWIYYDDPDLIKNSSYGWTQSVYQWTMPIGRRSPNALGLYDMTGNVAEWCSDWYSDTFYQTQSKFINPTGPKEGELKVVRGGNWGIPIGPLMDIRFRIGKDPSKGYPYIGFRLAMDDN